MKSHVCKCGEVFFPGGMAHKLHSNEYQGRARTSLIASGHRPSNTGVRKLNQNPICPKCGSDETAMAVPL